MKSDERIPAAERGWDASEYRAVGWMIVGVLLSGPIYGAATLIAALFE